MSTVDARDITKPVDEDFVPQTTAELRALKVLVAAIETALQNEDLDIRADVTTLLRSKLQVPILDLALPTLVANGALIVNGAGTGLVWDADYGEFVANAAALTGAVEAATIAAGLAQDAAEAAQAAVDTGAVNKASTAEQIMNGDLTIQRDAARIRLQSDTTPANTLDLGISGGFASLTLGGALDLNVIGDVAFVSQVNFNGGIRTVGPSAIDDDVTVSSGNTVEFQAGSDLTIADAPVAATDAVNKAYVDGRVSITSLRLVTSQTSGAGLQFDTAYRNDNNYWNAGTKYVSAPNKYGAVTVNVNVNNGNAAQVTRTLTLEIAGVERAKVRVDIPAGTQRVVGLSYMGPLSGRVEVEIDNMADITFMGSNSGPTTTNFGMVVYE